MSFIAVRLSRRLLYQTVENLALTVYSTPQLHLRATDLHKNLVQVPDFERGITAFADPAGIGLSEFRYPQTNCLGADVDSSVRQEIFDISLAHRETIVEPHGLADNIGMEAVSPVGDFLHRVKLPPDQTYP